MNANELEPKRLWHLHEGDGPTVGLAVHAGHEVRPDLLPLMKMDEATHLREEDLGVVPTDFRVAIPERLHKPDLASFGGD